MPKLKIGIISNNNRKYLKKGGQKNPKQNGGKDLKYDSQKV